MKRQELMEMELIERIDTSNRELRAELTRLQLQVGTQAEAINNAGIVNLLDNTDWNWSQAGYTTAGITPATAGDTNNRAFNWYRMERASALLVEDDAHSLKGSAHSLFGGESADTPRWNKTDGWAEMGETGATPWDLACPLPNNFVTPGMRFRLQMLVRLRTDADIPGPLKFFWSLYDNTNSAPAPRVIQGAPFNLDGATFGPLGGNTRSYKLIVDVDSGNQVESTVETLNDTPAVLTASNGVALSWPQFPGFTNVSIYVTEGGANFLVAVIGNGANAFNDTGQRLGPVGAIPVVTDTQPRAYAEAAIFSPTQVWSLWRFNIGVPQTYNFGLTTGKQWLRGGIIGLLGEPHQLEIDRLGLSTGDGLWSPSIRDLSAASGPSTTQTGSQQGPPSGGLDPGDGEGEPVCATLETPIDVCDEDGSNERKMLLGDIDDAAVRRGVFVVSGNETPSRVTACRPGWSEIILTIETENGAMRRCSPSDRWIEIRGPLTGTHARRLCESMEVMTRINGSVQPSRIVRYSTSIQGEEVRLLSTEGDHETDHIYWAGGAAAHNVKTLFLL